MRLEGGGGPLGSASSSHLRIKPVQEIGIIIAASPLPSPPSSYLASLSSLLLPRLPPLPPLTSPPSPPSPPLPPPPSLSFLSSSSPPHSEHPTKSKEERIAEKKAKRRAAELATEAANETKVLSDQEEKMRKEALQKESDLHLAMETFGVSDRVSGGIDSMNPTSEEEFNRFKDVLSDKIVSLEVHNVLCALPSVYSVPYPICPITDISSLCEVC